MTRLNEILDGGALPKRRRSVHLVRGVQVDPGVPGLERRSTWIFHLRCAGCQRPLGRIRVTGDVDGMEVREVARGAGTDRVWEPATFDSIPPVGDRWRNVRAPIKNAYAWRTFLEDGRRFIQWKCGCGLRTADARELVRRGMESFTEQPREPPSLMV